MISRIRCSFLLSHGHHTLQLIPETQSIVSYEASFSFSLFQIILSFFNSFVASDIDHLRLLPASLLLGDVISSGLYLFLEMLSEIYGGFVWILLEASSFIWRVSFILLLRRG
jgi:hypothetical protein